MKNPYGLMVKNIFLYSHDILIIINVKIAATLIFIISPGHPHDIPINLAS